MGIVIVSEDDKVELWQSSYGTFSYFRQMIRKLLVGEYVKDLLDNEYKKETETLEKAKEKVPELKLMIEIFIDTTLKQKIYDEKRIREKENDALQHIYNMEQKSHKSNDYDNLDVNEKWIPGIKALMEHSYHDGEWTSKECFDIYTFMIEITDDNYNYNYNFGTEFENYNNEWNKLRDGLKYCYDNNRKARFI